jgi:hypothetical protein
MSSDEIIDYLLEDTAEIVTDTVALVGRESGPEVVRINGHRASQCSARVINSATAAAVSFVGRVGRGALKLVAMSGMRKSIDSW